MRGRCENERLKVYFIVPDLSLLNVLNILKLKSMGQGALSMEPEKQNSFMVLGSWKIATGKTRLQDHSPLYLSYTTLAS